MRTCRSTYTLALLIGYSALLLLGSAAQASVQVNLGGSPLTGPAENVPDDAVTLLFENTATVDKVKLTINVNGTSTKVTEILFNVDPLITGLGFADVSGPTATKSYAADSKGMGVPLTGFDISFQFSSAGSNGALWFGSGPAVFEITKTSGTGTLTENSFSFTNPNSYYGAVHINVPNGNARGNSGKYGSTDGTVPEPGTMAVWGLLALTGYFGVKKYQAKA